MLDDDARFRDIYINPLSAALASNQFLFELYPLGNVLNAKDIVKKLDPVRPGVVRRSCHASRIFCCSSQFFPRKCRFAYAGHLNYLLIGVVVE